MVKPLYMRIAVEESFFGKVYRALDNMSGVASIELESEMKQAESKPPRQKKGGTQSAACLVLGALIKTPGCTRAQLKPVLEGNGKSASSLPDTLTKLLKAGEIRSSGSGSKRVTYRATPAGVKRYNTACQIENGGAQ